MGAFIGYLVIFLLIFMCSLFTFIITKPYKAMDKVEFIVRLFIFIFLDYVLINIFLYIFLFLLTIASFL